MNKKCFISAFLVIVVLFSSVGVFALEDTQKSDIFNYIVSGNAITITGVDDVRADVTVPNKIDGIPVRRIADGAFGGSSVITSVYIPDSVTDIGSMCFAYSSSIRTVRLSRSIKTISEGMFYQATGLIGISLPYGIINIESRAFSMCPMLASVGIPNSIQAIADDAFALSPNVRFFCYCNDGAVGYTYAQNKNIPCEDLITVYVNGTEIDFDQPPVTDTKRFRTLVPLRAVLEFMGAKIEWHNDMNYAGIDIDGHRLLIRPESTFMMVNNNPVTLSSPAVEYNNRIVIPIRDVVTAVGGKVTWDEFNKVVTITY